MLIIPYRFCVVNTFLHYFFKMMFYNKHLWLCLLPLPGISLQNRICGISSPKGRERIGRYFPLGARVQLSRGTPFPTTRPRGPCAAQAALSSALCIARQAPVSFCRHSSSGCPCAIEQGCSSATRRAARAPPRRHISPARVSA